MDDVDLDLGRVNVIVGTNGCGKTNLMEALAVLGCAASGEVDEPALFLRGVHAGAHCAGARRAHPSAQRSLEARSARARYLTVLRPRWAARWEMVRERVEERGTVLGRRVGSTAVIALAPPPAALVPIVADRDRSIVQPLRVVHHSGGMAYLTDALRQLRVGSPPQAAPFPSPLATYADLPFGLARRPGLWARVLREACSLIQWFDPARHPAVPFRAPDRYLAPEYQGFPLAEADGGTLHVLHLLLLVMHPHTPPVVMMRDFAASLNPGLALRLMRRILDLVLGDTARPQLILATYNPAVLDALDLSDDRVRLFVSERSRTGATSVRRMPQTFGRPARAEHEVPLSQLWTSGILGGMPPL